jgi:hypothetical protein
MAEPLTKPEARAYHLGKAILELIELGALAFYCDHREKDTWVMTVYGQPWDPIFADFALIETDDFVGCLIDIAEEAQERAGKAAMKTDGDGPDGAEL